MRLIKIGSLLLGLLPTVASAVVVSWTNPTTYTDGTSIPSGVLTGTRVEWGTCAGSAFGTKAGEQTIPQPMVSVDLGAFAPGTHCFRTYARTATAESGPSMVAQKTVAAPIPNPPTLLTVSGLAYELNANKLGTRVVGNVELGTACIEPLRALSNGQKYYQVATSSVTFVDGYKRKGNTFVVACDMV